MPLVKFGSIVYVGPEHSTYWLLSRLHIILQNKEWIN